MAVQSDSKWLQFILNQLLTNSLKYTAIGEIVIATVETQQEKQLIIQDNGIGLNRKTFLNFNQGFTGKMDELIQNPQGMGLYLAQQLSNNLGHFITCTSRLHVHTEFILHFQKLRSFLLLNTSNEYKKAQ
jgi:signal transduction histidine kinase